MLFNLVYVLILIFFPFFFVQFCDIGKLAIIHKRNLITSQKKVLIFLKKKIVSILWGSLGGLVIIYKRASQIWLGVREKSIIRTYGLNMVSSIFW
jgi:hypothetical protein